MVSDRLRPSLGKKFELGPVTRSGRVLGLARLNCLKAGGFGFGFDFVQTHLDADDPGSKMILLP